MFIPVTTIPAAGNVAFGIVFGVPEAVWGCTGKLLLTLSGMAPAGWAMLAFRAVVWSRVSAHLARLVHRLGRG